MGGCGGNNGSTFCSIYDGFIVVVTVPVVDVTVPVVDGMVVVGHTDTVGILEGATEGCWSFPTGTRV